ncbi:MAG TPA: DUF692 domain-containing protein [Bradyrhizobium sp.]|uniref:MNIO family bufferin maturase n=1 Tax=Bradyrhizobium sp. TaxID=376 RepID=UPI002D0A8DBF|nr:DUF692 domain-containing protein [Bradyrhizobium sp.]HTA99449.1 DUF692 domain-containing protein [Bradyrhizobium sp.]
MQRMSSLPASAGIGFKPAHFRDILAAAQPIGFFEVHAENYMGAGGPPHAQLGALRERHALSVHGVGLSIGSMRPLDRVHLARLKALCERYQPESFSEHLAWSSHGEVYFNDLLPLPYTSQTLARVVEHVDEVQTVLGRQMLLENPSTYLRFAESTIPEVDFLAEVASRTGCGLLLDINNVFVSSRNHGTEPLPYLDSFPLDTVKEIHLGGHHEEADDAGAPLLIDSHGSPVADVVWTLYAHVIARTGPIATLIEWDNEVPDWSTLRAEAVVAQGILGRAARASAA